MYIYRERNTIHIYLFKSDTSRSSGCCGSC